MPSQGPQEREEADNVQRDTRSRDTEEMPRRQELSRDMEGGQRRKGRGRHGGE